MGLSAVPVSTFAPLGADAAARAMLLGADPIRLSLRRGVLAYWPVDEAPGSSRRDLIGGHTLTNNAVGQADGIAGQKAGQFTAATPSYLNAASHADFHLGGGTRTFGLWVLWDILGTQTDLVTVWTQTGNLREWRIQKLSTDVLRIQASSTGADNTGAAMATWMPVVGRWYWVEAGYDSVSGRTFCRANLGPLGSAVPVGLFSGSSDFRIGAEFTTVIAAPHDGRIGPAALWNRLLSDQERNWIVNGGLGRPLMVTS